MKKTVTYAAALAAILSSSSVFAQNCDDDVAQALKQLSDDAVERVTETAESSETGFAKKEDSFADLSCLSRTFDLKYDVFDVPTFPDLEALAQAVVCDAGNQLIDRALSRIPSSNTLRVGDGNFEFGSVTISHRNTGGNLNNEQRAAVRNTRDVVRTVDAAAGARATSSGLFDNVANSINETGNLD